MSVARRGMGARSALIVLVVLLVAPHVVADHELETSLQILDSGWSNGYSLTMTSGATASSACAPTNNWWPDPVDVSPGTRYIFKAGVSNSVSPTLYIANESGTPLLGIKRDGTFIYSLFGIVWNTTDWMGWSPTIIAHANDTATAFRATIAFSIPTVGDASVDMIQPYCEAHANARPYSQWDRDPSIASDAEMDRYVHRFYENTTGNSIVQVTDIGTLWLAHSELPPDPPVVQSVSDNCNGVLISWSPGSDGGSPILNYSVRRQSENESAELVAASIPAGTEEWEDDAANMTAGHTYSYFVNATNAEGTSSPLVVTGARDAECDEMPVFGEDGAIYGRHVDRDGNVVGGRDALAASLQISGEAVSFLYGIIWTVGLAITGFSVGGSYRGYAAGVGAVAGVILSLVFGFFPVWLVAFVGVLGTAAYVKFGRGE